MEGRMPEHGFIISSPCESDGSSEVANKIVIWKAEGVI